MAAPTGADARDFPLLTTKFFIPAIRPDLVPRVRLIQRLNAGLGGKLTLVSAPPGFGKTTLLSEWVRQSEPPTAWLSLDEGDNDLARFWTYVIAAIQRVHADVGEAALAMLRSPQPPPTKMILTDLINEIVFLAAPFVLVLDDFHIISEQQIHETFLFLLDNLPPQMHVALSTRSDPPWPLARLRTRGQMVELRVENLRFTLEEVTAFLKDAMGLDLSSEQVAALDERTEGWIGGLQMAAVSMQGRGDVSGFVQAFTGSNRYVLDYLVEEVLQRQPDHIQTFLLHTSVLDRLCGPLCDAVLGNQQISKSIDEQMISLGKSLSPVSADLRFVDLSGQTILEYLEAANLFIVPLDDRREWYRYHRLFADSLRRRLYRTSVRGGQPDLVPELHRRASAWYERRAASTGENENMMAAIEHALAAEDFERAADLMEREAEAILMQSYVATFRGWIERTPDEVVRARPTLSYLYAFALLLSGYTLDAAEARLQDVDTDDDGRGAALRALVAVSQGQLCEAIELSQVALRRLPEGELISRALAMWILSISQTASSNVWTQSRALDEVVRMGQESGSLTVTVAALCYQAALCMRLGQLHKAKAMFEQALIG
jgi:LuxR family maltose regulon positive regulatory protein